MTGHTVRVPDVGNELHLGGHLRVVLGEDEVRLEEAALAAGAHWEKDTVNACVRARTTGVHMTAQAPQQRGGMPHRMSPPDGERMTEAARTTTKT